MTSEAKNPICTHCDREMSLQSGVKIRIGKETFKTDAVTCGKCKRVLYDRTLRRRIDAWGKSLKRNVIEPQPFFSSVTHEYLDRWADDYGLKKIQLIKALCAFYFTKAVSKEDFTEIKSFLDQHESRKMLEKGTKEKINVPIRYLLYKDIQTYCDVWDRKPAKAIEEAVLFGLGLLSVQDMERLRVVAGNLVQYIEEYALVA